MRTPTALLIAGLLALVACGEDEDGERRAPMPTPQPAAAGGTTEDAAQPEREPRRGTRLRVGGSEFGRMLFDADNQAVYVFERDSNGKSRCYGACAEAWPPVFANGRPVAGKGVRAALLGTVKRRGGRRQVTYAGKPLYYYAHEGPGEVLCHNVNLNGGYWWVVGPDGKRRP
jgi:predicted lipoprotein with Yx(FWY)xxD motif